MRRAYDDLQSLGDFIFIDTPPGCSGGVSMDLPFETAKGSVCGDKNGSHDNRQAKCRVFQLSLQPFRTDGPVTLDERFGSWRS